MKRWKTQNKTLLCAAVAAGLLLAVDSSGHQAQCAAQSERPRTVSSAVPAADGTQAGEWRRNLTSDEQRAIERAGGGNDRVKTYVRLAETRLHSAREALNQDDFAAAEKQLEAYAALVGDAGQFTKSSVPMRDKAHKTLEQALRVQIRLLEGIRRDTPADHADTVEKAIATANRVRTQALNLLLGSGTFLSEPEKETKKTPDEKSG
jgi:hypothetical protein